MFVCQTVWSHPGGLAAKFNSSNLNEMRTGHLKTIITKFSLRMCWAKRHWVMWRSWVTSTNPCDKTLTSMSWKCCTAATVMAKQQHDLAVTFPKVLQRSWMHLASWMISIVILWIGHHKNVVAVALADMVFLFDASTGNTKKLLQVSRGSVTTLRWTESGGHLSIGSSCGEVQIWDAASQRQLRNLRGHSGRIGALAWHKHMLSSGCADAEVHQHDVRVREHLVSRMSAHSDLVCGLDYNSEGMLASGGNDNIVCIWETPTAETPVHTFTEHQAAVKALKWCPWQRHVLATGGGSADRQICLWNASSGRLLMSTNAESQVTGILWGEQERELLTSTWIFQKSAVPMEVPIPCEGWWSWRAWGPAPGTGSEPWWLISLLPFSRWNAAVLAGLYASKSWQGLGSKQQDKHEHHSQDHPVSFNELEAYRQAGVPRVLHANSFLEFLFMRCQKVASFCTARRFYKALQGCMLSKRPISLAASHISSWIQMWNADNVL